MRKVLIFFLVISSTSFGTATMTFAQANNGAGEGKNRTYVSFYKLPPGRQDEWLALYKKWHFPVMQYEKAHGQVISETVYTRVEHHLSPAWDIAIVIVAPPANKTPKPEMTRGQLIRHLFPNLDEYVKGERERWSITLEHWDEEWVPIDMEKNPSLYYPAPE